MISIKTAIAAGLTLSLTVGSANLVRAQEAPAAASTPQAQEGTLQEVVVSAQKRTETAQSVPISLTVMTNEQLTRQGVQTIVDLSRMSASLEFTAPGAAPGGGAFVRGIGTESVGGLTVTPSVSVVLDGVVTGNTNVTDIFDINRVEVLKGPQGTLFGSSVSAGVLNITTNAPDPSSTSATVNAEYGSGDFGSEYNRRALRAAVNLPLTADSALRFSFHSDDNLGVFNNTYQNLSSDQPSIGGRVRYLLKVNDDITINIIGDYNSTHETNTPVLTYRYAPPGSALANALAQCGVTASDYNFDTCSQYYNVFEQIDRGASLQLDWNLGGPTLTFISSYRLGDTNSRGDIQAIPLAITQQAFAFPNNCHFFDCVPIFAILPGGINDLQTQHRTQFNEELRLASPARDRLQWVVGVYYQHFKDDYDQPGLINAFFTGGQFADTTFTALVHSEDYAAFGNLTFSVTDALRLIAGARYTHSTIDESKYDPSVTFDNVTYSLGASASKPTWRAGVQWDLSPATMLYGTISTGYKAPEISDALAPNPNPGQPWNGGMYVVNPELPISYELGIKQSFLDNRLAVDADVFYEHVKDYQGQACSPGPQGTIICPAANIPYIDTKGIELEVFGRPLRGLSVNLSAIYNPATYPPEFKGTDGSNLGGEQLNYASKTKVTVSAEQTIPVSANYSAVIGADYTYRSEQSQYTSGLPEFVAPASHIFNARIGVTSSKNWSLYVFGRNIGAERFTRQLYPTPFQTGGLWQVFDANAKRVVGLQLEAHF